MAEEQMRRLSPAELDPLTEATIVDWDVLLEELRTVRSQGWAESHGERVRGAFAVSAPIFDERGEVVAAVSILGPEARLTRTRLIEFRRALLSAATRASSLVSAPVPEASNTVA
jgi:DNA-binding IclR family transcriptional regulator